MAQGLTTRISGLWTFPSDLSGAPEGSLAVADNIVIDRDSEAEPRRGFDYLTHGGTQSQFSSVSYRANKLFFYQGFTLAHYASSTLAYHDPTTGWQNFAGTFNPPTVSVKVRAATASQNFYFTTSAGVQKLDSVTGTPKAIGCPPGLDLTAAVASAPSSTWLPVGYSTAYRLVWGYTDANQNLILGAPTQRAEITNTTAAAVSVALTSTIPSGITTAHFYQLYRAQSTNSGTTAGFIEPNDELGLVYEGNPTAGDLAAGFITITDLVPDSLRGATIYTAQSQEGLANANEPVPLAYDLAEFRNCMFYGNTTGLQNFFLNLLGTGSPSGLQSSDTLVIGGVTYTASTSSENASTGQFLITPVFSLTTTGTTAASSAVITSVGSTTGVTAGMSISDGVNKIPAGSFVVSTTSTTITINQNCTGIATGESITITGDSAAQSIRDTALSLVRVVNKYASSTVYAFYESGPNDLPGKMLFQGRTAGQAAFVVTASRATCWSPSLPSSGTTQSSTADAWKNGLFYSKVLEPEAVPLANYFRVGSADKAILRIIALRDSLFVLKEDGVFRVSGTDPSNFEVWPLDYTNVLIAPESAVALNNQIFALTTQGVVTISETGVKIMSRPIESALTSLSTANYALLQTATFGVAYESSRAYYLFTITNATDSGPTQYYRYNTITNAWTHGTLAKTCGGVNPVDDKLYLGNSALPIIDVERKNLSYSDYADYQSTQVLSGISGNPTTFAMTSSDTVQVGSIIYQSPTVFSTVTQTNPIAGTVTVSLPTTLVNGNADVLAPVSAVVEWLPQTLANPGVTKHMREVALLFRSLFNGSGTVGFVTDVSPSEADETIQGGNVGGWGLFAWGGPAETSLGVSWGGDAQRKPIRVMIPRIHQRSSLLTVKFSHAYAFSPWTLQGISYIGDITSERMS